MLPLTDWLVGVFWQAFANWVERDPDAARERIAALMEERIEQIVASQEAADAETP